MSATLARPTDAGPVTQREWGSRSPIREALVVLLAAALGLVAKLLIAWNTLGTNDTIFFYHLGNSLSNHGLKWAYANDVAFNHPPLVAAFIRSIYELDHLPWLHEYGITFPFLLRCPGIVSDFLVVLILLRAVKQLQLPIWALLVLALSPVSLMVSGFHGNTDSVMVLFLVLAALMCLRERPMICGLFLALSSQIKIIPLLLVPIFFFYWLPRRRSFAFTLPFVGTMVLLWIEPLLRFPGIFFHRVLLYGSFWGLWGITYWLKLSGVNAFSRVTYLDLLPLQQIVATVLKVMIIIGVLVVGWRRRKLDARGLFATHGWAWVTFFILSPGVCAQYMVWLMPFVLVLSPGFFTWLTAASALFLFFFYNSIAGGLPWYLGVSIGPLNGLWLPWSLWPWATLIVSVLLLWNRALQAEPTLRLCSLSSVKPPSR
jgi:uncharacterized membrane protein